MTSKAVDYQTRMVDKLVYKAVETREDGRYVPYSLVLEKEIVEKCHFKLLIHKSVKTSVG